MSRDEIFAMPVGRELDALVAKVMGWTEFSPIDPTIDYGHGVNGYLRNFAKDTEGRLTWFPFYSTDMSEAWEVFEMLKNKFPWVGIDTHKPGYRCLVIDDEKDHSDGFGETAPLAICRAVLLTTIGADKP